MSGGHYDYQEWKIREVTESVAGDLSGPPDPDREWMPKDQALADLVRGLGEAVFDICHDVDYHISGDSALGDMDEYRGKVLHKLRQIVLEADLQHNRLMHDKERSRKG